MSNPLVSINCITYNHEPYIEDCLKGFVSQKTDFEFEVLIHDDASTDKTADIIKKYEQLYPEIIKPIYQKENQYSKGIKVGPVFNISRAKGQYIAFCEGDDFWIDDNKLQMQVDYMCSHPECSLCCTGAKLMDYNKNCSLIDYHITQGDDDLSTENVIDNGGGYIPTASILTKLEYVKERRPEAFYCKGVGDYPMQIYLSLLGKVHYIDRITTVYRRNTPGSWTVNNMYGDKLLKHNSNVFTMLDNINEYTNHQYQEVISNMYKKNVAQIICSAFTNVAVFAKSNKNAKNDINLLLDTDFVKNFFADESLLNGSRNEKIKLKMLKKHKISLFIFSVKLNHKL